MRILPGDRQQALRCKRILMASAAYLLWMGVATYLWAVGLLRIGSLDTLSLYFAGVVATNLLVFGVVRSGLNLRFRDPSLTLAQIVVAILWATVLLAYTVPIARGLVLLLFTTVFFFGIFKLKTLEFFALTVFAILLYGGLLAWEASVLTRLELQTALAQLLVLAAVLSWMSLMGGYVARLRADLRKALRQIEELARTDELTGTENRRSITEALQGAIGAGRKTGEKVSVCLLDIDRFKYVNDRFGHHVGDEVLRQFVSRVESVLREADKVNRRPWPGALGRFGGEEFLVVLHDSDEEGGRLAAERIRTVVGKEPFETEAGRVRISVSVGVASWKPHEDEVDLLRRADRALYRAKEDGRNCVRLASGLR